ncbi:MAG: Trp biosynthesis-associated membrane protein [Sporichthyaceae bacterium]
MTASRREPLVALGGLLAGVALTTFAASRNWVDGQAVAGELRVPLQVSGASLAPAVPTLALAALAGLLALVATRGVLRRVAAVLVAACGVGAALTAALKADPGDGELADRAGEAIGTGTALAQVDVTGWAWLAVLGGLSIGAAGLLAAVRVTGWPGMSARYNAPEATAAATESAPVRERTTAGDSALQTWRAMDRGEDPTAHE